ncbi:hypothetical protein PPERSA_03423 [Pseudocohnilembus persalinus]|uniref:Uncharacterized protein n=1 Tax=Pseudocohnilembus persalinus TaxID=266149 RepID=A0A0V0QBK5_PSEPJ|nr:hypothetical protein PPERSA_03423 [Pseudocohnilembus persalinus]|eukprot:KRW99622.1 hypothetical protein PPERSA_03423 [Pseudocohnilembus persalinus]
MGENYEQFLKWLDQPEQIMKEIWQFEEIYSLRRKETQQIKNFKKLLKQASIEMYSNYMINQIIRSGEVQHSKTFQNSQIKKQALIQTLSDFLIQVNDVKNLNGIFSDKKQMKKQDNNQQDQINGNKKVILGKGNGQQIIINSNSNIIQNDLTGNDQDFSQQESQKQYNENKNNKQNKNNQNYKNNYLDRNQEIQQKQEQIVIQKQQDQNCHSNQDNKN